MLWSSVIKVYTLDTSSQAAKDELDKLAWEQAKVTGDSQRRHDCGEIVAPAH